MFRLSVYAVSAALIAFSVFTYVSQEEVSANQDHLAYSRAKTKMLNDTIDALLAMPLKDKLISSAAMGQYLNTSNIQLGFLQRGYPLPNTLEQGFDVSDAAVDDVIRRGDYILAFDPTGDVIGWLPAAPKRAEFIERIKASGKFALVKTIYDPTGAGPLYIYARRSER